MDILNAYIWRPSKNESSDMYLVLQTIVNVVLFTLDKVQASEYTYFDMSEDDEVAPIPIIFFHKYFYFVHKESNTNSSIVAVEIEPKGKPQR